MFTNKSQPESRGPGRPPGITPQGEQMREHLYEVALGQFAAKGFGGTTMRGIAAEAGVSAGLLYKYFPSKAAVVMALYDGLSLDFEGCELPAGSWRIRVLAALRASLASLAPHRGVLASLAGLLVADAEHGLFSAGTAASRERVMGVFLRAVGEANDVPRHAVALGRVMYVAHLAVVLFWLLDRSEAQRATTALLALVHRVAGPLALVMRMPGAAGVVAELDAVVLSGLLGLERDETT